jgi:3-phenylpropionate/trans-cinnamate dioxygenase ferredoxin reductase subunit
VPALIATVIEARHRAEGVEVICGANIVDVDSKGSITLQDGRTIASDLVVAGIGSVPVTDIAAAADLVIDNGIAVDGQLRTSDPVIFAAGDCCSFPHPLYDGKRIRIESWRAAQEQGAHAARAMLGATDDYQSVPWFWSDQYELGLQIAGLSGEASQTVRRDLGDGCFILFHLADTGRLLAASGIGLGNSVARDIRVAEMLIAKRSLPDPAALGDPALKLRSLLTA